MRRVAMAEPVHEAPGPLSARLDPEWLTEWIRGQRWFASKSQALTSLELVEEVAVNENLSLAICQIQLASGAHELYQLALAEQDGEILLGQLINASRALSLLDAIESGRSLQGSHGRFCFLHVGEDPAPRHVSASELAGAVRPVGAEQSNSSIVFDDQFILKLFRRLESGINPELEMLRFLTLHGYPHIAPLHGWYEYEGEPLAATLGILQ